MEKIQKDMDDKNSFTFTSISNFKAIGTKNFPKKSNSLIRNREIFNHMK